MTAAITAFDFSVLFWIQEHLRCAALDIIFPLIGRLGSAGVFWITLGIVLLSPRKTRAWGICVLMCLLIDCAIGEGILKHLIERVRPCVQQPISEMLIAVPVTSSFPSGHTASSFTAATAIFHFSRRAGIAAYIIAALIAFSRLYCYVHFPTDILGGMALGICVACVITPPLKAKLTAKIKV